MKEIVTSYPQFTFVFKPHPSLYTKLCVVWGKEKTQSYYDWWEKQSNACVFMGPYMDLFFESTAIMHDCVSFTNEWLFTQAPGLYLFRENAYDEGESQMRKDALKAYYHAKKSVDIKNFIENVLVKGEDTLKEKRKAFFDQYYAPKDSITNCDRIVKEILG